MKITVYIEHKYTEEGYCLFNGNTLLLWLHTKNVITYVQTYKL